MPCPSGVFSTRSLYRSLLVTPRDSVPSSSLWRSPAPPGVEVFCWLAVLGKGVNGGQPQEKRFEIRDSSKNCVRFAVRMGRP